MSEFDIFEAIGEIDDDLIETERKPKAFKRFLPAVAALCLVTVIFALSARRIVESGTVTAVDVLSGQKRGDRGVITVSTEEIKNAVFFNELDSEPTAVTGMIALFNDDFSTMTEREILDYFQVNCRGIVLKKKDYGVYKNSERGIYYDTNTLEFESENGGRFNLTLSKTFRQPFMYWKEYDGNVTQSEINGVGITIFSFTADKKICFHSELDINGVKYDFNSSDMSRDEYVTILSKILSDNPLGEGFGADDIHKLIGRVSAVDSYAGLIGITAEDGTCLTAYLSPDEMKKYELNDTVELTYTGNPITAGNVWRQQINSISRRS